MPSQNLYNEIYLNIKLMDKLLGTGQVGDKTKDKVMEDIHQMPLKCSWS
jgi:hypothetical protein